MTRRRGFTLGEVLVVAAIVAILAAILFPIFAQAKESSRATVTLSNLKQNLSAAVMYSSDSDDVAMLAQLWGPKEKIDVGGDSRLTPWTILVQPYLENYEVLTEPMATQPVSLLKSSDHKLDKAVQPAFGYNFVTMSPWVIADRDFRPVSMDGPSDLAQTVMMATSYVGFAETGGVFGWYGPKVRWATIGLIDSPDCWDGKRSLCWDGWGASHFWGPSYFAGMTPERGSNTGGVSARYAGGATVGFVDGHMKRMRAGALAAGTNWTQSRKPSQIRVTDRSQYLWDLE